MRKQTKKQLQDFNNEVIEILEFYGASRVENPHTRMITYIIDSEKIGELSIKLEYETSRIYTIYTKFDDPEKAVKFFNISVHNGKMNSHEYSPEPCLTFIDELLDNYNQINGIDSHAAYLEVNSN
ncbi:hypothetical protein CIL05_07160 [Virgibacillus profundi]|uniref:Uncharacterized protein n=1 Tax=Virgibacillus profundi TaxID=2024555 RepID=A0A2A2IES6_9BACI|nr:hypothetical protein [Virgibacillus profundi]PAV30239.1 hypothetical protein CIL05_07160 [Virgibacillus profundi]PXY54411.1 hypothetical protein CIT14_07245 [Virgibacillus profundi]